MASKNLPDGSEKSSPPKKPEESAETFGYEFYPSRNPYEAKEEKTNVSSRFGVSNILTGSTNWHNIRLANCQRYVINCIEQSEYRPQLDYSVLCYHTTLRLPVHHYSPPNRSMYTFQINI